MPQRVPTFAELLAASRHSAVHLEMRDVYGVAEEDADFAAWKAGHRHDPDDRASWWNPFLATVSEAVARGVEFRRARVVSVPVTDYIRYEHACTFQNVAAGESVRWLPRRLASDLMLPGNDLWLFDGRVAKFGLFSGDGSFTGNVMSDDPEVVKRCVDAFEAVWERGIPHQDFEV
ncbi:DUF6879 family protein [Kitasatospora sp. NPDC048538]|uniref:DUF6879 family protein n=1 Tax=unclassified Kitasatospora TaxID=2633591 RepID=UPI00340C355E